MGWLMHCTSLWHPFYFNVVNVHSYEHRVVYKLDFESKTVGKLQHGITKLCRYPTDCLTSLAVCINVFMQSGREAKGTVSAVCRPHCEECSLSTGEN